MDTSNVNRKRRFKKGWYITFNIMLIIILLGIATYIFTKSFDVVDIHKMGYSEISNIDYKVCLKPNEFYEQECLNKDMKYIASLIDKIYVNIDYTYTTDQSVESSYTYSIIGKVIIADSSNRNNVFFSKNYELLKETVEEVPSSKIHSISKLVDIDYSKYNNLANKFKATYGVSSDARLEIHLLIHNDSVSTASAALKYDRNADLMINIPLSESSLNIALDYALLNNYDSIYAYSESNKGNSMYLGGAMALALLATIILVRMVLFVDKRTKYEKMVNKLLKDYDRLIVESSSIVHISEYNVIAVNKFEELLDVHDNLKLPIIFNEIKKGQKSLFYIKNDSDLYLFTLKASSVGDTNGKEGTTR